MRFLKRPQLIRRYSEPQFERGYISTPYTEKTVLADIQTMEDVTITTSEGTRSVQRLKVFCDEKLIVENSNKQQKGDRIHFQDKWFECTSSRLSDNTPLRHYTATFVECLDEEEDEEEEEEDES